MLPPAVQIVVLHWRGGGCIIMNYGFYSMERIPQDPSYQEEYYTANHISWKDRMRVERPYWILIRTDITLDLSQKALLFKSGPLCRKVQLVFSPVGGLVGSHRGICPLEPLYRASRRNVVWLDTELLRVLVAILGGGTFQIGKPMTIWRSFWQVLDRERNPVARDSTKHRERSQMSWESAGKGFPSTTFTPVRESAT